MDCPTLAETLVLEPGGAIPEELRPRFEAHLSECAGCRERLEDERFFDRFLRRRLVAVPVPEPLQIRVREALAGVRRGRRRRAWVAAAAAVAATLAAGGVWLTGTAGWGTPAGVAGAAAGFRPSLLPTVVRGQLVCTGCARRGVEIARQRRCRPDGGQHATGLRAADGAIWDLIAGAAILDFQDKPEWRGRQVELLVKSSDRPRLLAVDAVRWL